MANIIKRFARNRDDMRLANFQRVRGLDAEWKLLRCPTEYSLPNLTPPWANRNLGANRSDVVSGGILKRDVNVAVRDRAERDVDSAKTLGAAENAPSAQAKKGRPTLFTGGPETGMDYSGKGRTCYDLRPNLL